MREVDINEDGSITLRTTRAQDLRIRAIIHLLAQAWGVCATNSDACAIVDHITLTRGNP